MTLFFCYQSSLRTSMLLPSLQRYIMSSEEFQSNQNVILIQRKKSEKIIVFIQGLFQGE